MGREIVRVCPLPLRPDMTLPPLTYLSFDATAEGIGLSQVVPYLERLAGRGLEVTLHSFEKEASNPRLRQRLERSGVRWAQHRFRGSGGAGGLLRVLYGAALITGDALVHARGILPATSCMLSRRPAWVWDLRAFWMEQRVALGLIQHDSVEARVLRRLESAAAKSSGAMITLTEAAIQPLQERHGQRVLDKTRVVTTCVDLERFRLSMPCRVSAVRLLLTGTLSRLYDVPAMVRLVERMRLRRPAELTVLTPNSTAWHEWFARVNADVAFAPYEEMPDRIAAHDVGLCLLRLDLGMSSLGAMPTKLGEFLACGKPVIVSSGLGDTEVLLARYRCGVVVSDYTDSNLDRAAEELEYLLDDDDTARRCRLLAEQHFDLDRGVDLLIGAYTDALRS